MVLKRSLASAFVNETASPTCPRRTGLRHKRQRLDRGGTGRAAATPCPTETPGHRNTETPSLPSPFTRHVNFSADR